MLNLREIDLSRSTIVPLEGEWFFVWKELLSPQELQLMQQEGRLQWTHVPAYWSKSKSDSVEDEGKGFATYGLTILVNDNTDSISLLIPEMMTSYRLWVNNEMASECGDPGMTEAETIPSRLSRVIEIEPKAGVVKLCLQISNFHHDQGGFGRRILLGSTPALEKSVLINICVDVLLFGCLITIGLYHVGIYCQRTKDRANLYFGIFALSLSIRVMTDNMLPLEEWFHFPWELHYRLLYFSYYFCVALFSVYLRYIFPKEMSKKVQNAIYIISGAFCAVVLLRPVDVFTKTLALHMVYTIALFLYCIGALILAVIRQRESAKWFLGAYLVLFFVALNDMLYSHEVISTGYQIHIGVFLFILAQSIFLSARFVKALALSEELSLRMESRIEERTQELNLAKEEAQDLANQAEEASKAKSAFLAMMSHEIRTPMNGILGMTSLLEHSELQPRQQDYIRAVKSSSETLLALINDILDFSKIEAGKIEIEKVPFSLRNCIDDALTVIAPKSVEKGLSLTCRYAHKIPDVLIGDPVRIKQVVTNLLSNAVKFTEEGHVHLNVSVKLESHNKIWIRISVIDSGIGISEEQKKHLFQSFSQADTSTTRKYGGTGLGLAISKRLSALMQGRLWFTSEQGNGSIFFFEIPLKELESLSTTPASSDKEVILGGDILLYTRDPLLAECLSEDFAYFHLKTKQIKEEELLLLEIEQSNIALLCLQAEEDPSGKLLKKLKEKEQHPPILYLIPCGTKHTYKDKTILYLEKPIRRDLLYTELKALWGGNEEKVTVSLEEHSEDMNMSRQYPLRILMAEDDPNNQQVARLMLRSLGYDLVIAENGLQAIEALGKTAYDVILMDIQMPEMDGLDAAKAISTNWPASEKPYIIALTAFALRGDKQKMLNAGMDDYLAKPITLESLSEKLKFAFTQIAERKRKS